VHAEIPEVALEKFKHSAGEIPDEIPSTVYSFEDDLKLAYQSVSL